ncbi:pimeloyl-ACP methyl ester carboxylesterase [Rhizobium sp. BK313]|uniref:alpha/beta fold hydrolase n=1 Tax=Rhizobium sp. BK313 TaxID=2587081 RepID=UPI0010DA67BD|nr:alpha/beta fold hydrolase [Rhizobium sp. BK313]MBB3456295.1 pimeloyl-ACP methyl ester carboxylesterase [Rhizobium sp. BK313]
MVGQLTIEVLGELNVRQQGQLLPLPQSKKTRALLAYLAVIGKPQRREHLCKMFWEVPDDPRASLRWSLHKLRPIVNIEGDERLHADHNSVLLSPQTIDVDFNGIASLRPADLDVLDTDALESLAATFRGEFLEGLYLPHCPNFEAWRLYHRDIALRVHTAILRALLRRLRDCPDRVHAHSMVLNRLTEETAGVDLPEQRLEPSIFRSELAESCGYAPDQSLRLPRPGSGLMSRTFETDVPLPSVTPSNRSQEIRFCKTADRVTIAYAVCGHGLPIVRAAHWMSHLQYDWESPVWRHWIDALSEKAMLIRYDERGTGLSDWVAEDISFTAMIADLESVVDAAGLDRFTLLGVSQSCAVSVAYAVRHPERVSGLILYGGFVKGWRKRSDSHEVATHEAMTALIREGWGQNNPVFRHLFTAMFIPGADQVQMDWFDELQRISVSPSNAGRLHEAFGDIDVSDVLSQVTVPTLVLHARKDAVVPFQCGREFATGIPGARFVDLDSANHILLANEPAFEQFVREARRFVAETA